MKSPSQLRQTLTKQWQSSRYRIARLLNETFPIELSIGKPSAKQVNQHTHEVKAHIQAWQDFQNQGIGEVTGFEVHGEVVWASHHYRSTNSQVRYPDKWLIHNAEMWRMAVDDEATQTEMAFVHSLLNDGFILAFRQQFPTESHQQLSLLLRHFSQLKTMIANTDVASAKLIIILANILTKGCANGLPLRAVSVQQIIDQADKVHENRPLYQLCKNQLLSLTNQLDSKFIERQQKLLCLLLSARFTEDINPQNFYKCLSADKHSAHWLLCTSLTAGTTNTDNTADTSDKPKPAWLPFSQMRVRDSDLMTVTDLPFDTILIVENEQCFHHIAHFQHTRTEASLLCNDTTLVILGAGNNLAWLQNPLWQNKCLLYWGDIDTWGLAILAQARKIQPHIQATLMDRVTLNNHQQYVVTEPSSYEIIPTGLTDDEMTLFAHLHTNQLRLEQEFLAVEWVSEGLNRFI